MFFPLHLILWNGILFLGSADRHFDPDPGIRAESLDCDAWTQDMHGKEAECWEISGGRIQDLAECCENNMDARDCKVIQATCEMYEEISVQNCECVKFCEYHRFKWCPLNAVQIAWIAVGSTCAFIALCVGLGLLIHFRKKRKKREAKQEAVRETTEPQSQAPVQICVVSGPGYFSSRPPNYHMPQIYGMDSSLASWPTVGIEPPSNPPAYSTLDTESQAMNELEN
jgi:hypothetical protein